MENPSIHASNVTHAYGGGATSAKVLKDFSITLAPGAFEALMGPSGSGKSTFLHLAAGLILPESGRIEIGGRDVTSMSDSAAARFRRRHVGVVFQRFNLLDQLTVADNITLPVRLDKAKPDLARLASLLDRLGIADKADRRPAELSGGERQRVAIARALFPEPDVVLADEPTGNLDAVAAKGICALLKEISASALSAKSAILLVTHDPMVAAAASKVHFLKGGRVAASFETAHDPELISRKYLETYS